MLERNTAIIILILIIRELLINLIFFIVICAFSFQYLTKLYHIGKTTDDDPTSFPNTW